jgi:hypothetical protein
MPRSLILASLLLSLAGCVADDGPAFFISDVIAPDDDCIYSVENVKLLRGTFNAEFGGEYSLAPILNSQLVGRGGDAPLRADPNNILLTGAVVELQDASGAPLAFGGLPNPFTVSVASFVESSDGTAPSQSVGAIQVIPPAYAAGLDAMLGDDPLALMVVVVQVEMFGETVGGVDVEAAPWSWPIDVCQGQCLFECVAAGVDVGDDVNTCTCGQDSVCPLPIGRTPC